MKPEKKNHVWRGIGFGFGVFALLSALILLTPLRSPFLAVAGREAPALAYRLQTQRDTMDALQRRASETRLSPAERASLEQVRGDYVATRERVDARARQNSRLTLLGLFDWTRDLFPWLLAFGLALPVLGGLIGAQVHPIRRTNPLPNAPRAPELPPLVPPAPVERKLALPPASVAPTSTRTPYVHPASAAARPLPGSPVAPPASEMPQDWGFRHQPTPLESRPRVKLPPVRSPNSADFGETPPAS